MCARCSHQCALLTYSFFIWDWELKPYLLGEKPINSARSRVVYAARKKGGFRV